MKKFPVIAAFTLLLLVFSYCKKEVEPTEKEPVIIEISEKTAALISQNNDFGIQLFKEVAVSETQNLMLSPMSASVALTMLLNGCDGETYHQIHEMLDYPSDMTISEVNQSYQNLLEQLLIADETIELALANAVFYRQGFEVKPPFLDAMQTGFSAHIEALDFSNPQSIETINNWAGDHTNEKITEVLQEIDADAVMFLMNALYFKGEWTQKFDAVNTNQSPFTLADGSVIQVPMMHASDMKSIYYSSASFEAVEIPYGRKNFSMIIILPNDALHEFYPIFTSEHYQQLTAALDAGTWTDMMISMPKFQFDYEKCLNEQLEALGMIDAFMPGLADLSNISDGDLYVDFVKQNTFVEVNEEGTEAAAVTTIGINETSTGLMFDVNRPFIFVIRERTSNSLLFVGAVSNPLE